MSQQYILQNSHLFNRISPLEKQTKFISKQNSNLGEISILFNPSTQEEFILRETRFKNFQFFEHNLKIAQKWITLQIKGILKLWDFSSISYQDSGSHWYILREFYENPQSFLFDLEKKVFSTNLNYFEMIQLFYQCIQTCSQLQSQQLFLGNLNPGIFLRFDNNEFQLAKCLCYTEDFPQNQISTFLAKENAYISPEIVQAIDQEDSFYLNQMNPYKSDVFSLGLCLLSLALRKDLQNIYDKNNNKYKEEILEQHLRQFKEEFQHCKLLYFILKFMLKKSPQERPDFLMLLKCLPDKESIDDFLSYCQQKKTQIQQVKTVNFIEKETNKNNEKNKDNFQPKKEEKNKNIKIQLNDNQKISFQNPLGKFINQNMNIQTHRIHNEIKDIWHNVQKAKSLKKIVNPLKIAFKNEKGNQEQTNKPNIFD